ncbi:MAG: hypothetical protein EON93_05655 [Burkholderiales bacterium]|nr:MAG: hypothetical protein EON93_05655 [Burkholderiales bacterium]
MTPATPSLPFYRVLTLSGAVLQQDGMPPLDVVSLRGEEAINALFEYRVVVQTPEREPGLLPWCVDAALLLGQPLTVHLELDGSAVGERQISGIVTEVIAQDSDPRHQRLQLVLRPGVWEATLGVHSHGFQDMRVLEVLDAVLGHYPWPVDKRLIETYPVIDLITQYQESDWRFMCRLMQQWGINHHFEHVDGAHRLILSDHNSAFTPFGDPEGAYHRIPIHPPGHRIDREYIHAFVPTRRITSERFEARDHDYTRPRLVRVAFAQKAANYFHQSYDFINTPWQARYTIHISKYYTGRIEVARQWNIKMDHSGSAGARGWDSLFTPIYPLKELPETPAVWTQHIGFQLIEYDRSGRVLTPNQSAQPLTGRTVVDSERRRAVRLVAGDGEPGSYWYRIGTWFEGFIGGGSEAITPALCDHLSDDERYRPRAHMLRAAPKKKVFSTEELGDLFGTIGCREWAYQLKRPASLLGKSGFAPDAQGQCESGAPPEELESGKRICAGLVEYSERDWQPYIDVTSHQTSRKYGREAYIGDVLGWARFDDPVRPVIGQVGRYWVCFHECPDGEKPGVIPNFRLWLARRGWPVPQPIPFFADHKFVDPDADYSGE